MVRQFFAFSLLALLPAAAHATYPPALPTPSEQQLADTLRGLLLKFIPDPLFAAEPGWGKQAPALIDPHKMKNQGAWRKLKVTALNPAQTLIVEVRNVRQPKPALMAFDLLVGFDAQLDFQQQIWERGLRVYSGSTKARAKFFVALKVEVGTRFEAKGLIPDIVFRLHISSADLAYSGVDVLHTAGVGGDPAKVLGEALRGLLKELRPDAERDLMARADAAILKAGECKEVRISLGKLFKLAGK